MAKWRGGLTFKALALTFGLAVLADIGAATLLYNYDGEMGSTPPPSLFETTLVALIPDLILYLVTWLAWKFVARVAPNFWRTLFIAFLIRGCLGAGLQLGFLKLYGPSAFTIASYYRAAGISLATALILGSFLAATGRYVDHRNAKGPSHNRAG